MTAHSISNILKGQSYFCCLCFVSVEEDALGIRDEIVVNYETNTTEEIVKILDFLMGNKFSNDMIPHDAICKSCIKSAKDSYKFIMMCKDNSNKLMNIVDALNESVENTSDDLNSFKSLFIHIKRKDFSSKQYYDNQRAVTNHTTALTRFRSLLYGKYVRQNKNSAEPKSQRTRIHNYSKGLSDICDIIRENNRSRFKCKVCHVIFNRGFNFKKHYYRMHSAQDVECSECGKRYGSVMILNQHKYESHADIMCSECGKTYKNRYSLLYHMRQHSGETPYSCQYCDMKFKWSSRRAEHVRRRHLEPSVECDICHVKFRSLTSIYDHRKRHFNPNSRLHVAQLTQVAEEVVIN